MCRRVAAIPEGVREVLGLPSVPGGPLPGVPRPASARRGQRNLFEEALSETGSAGSVRTPLHLYLCLYLENLSDVAVRNSAVHALLCGSTLAALHQHQHAAASTCSS